MNDAMKTFLLGVIAGAVLSVSFTLVDVKGYLHHIADHLHSSAGYAGQFNPGLIDMGAAQNVGGNWLEIREPASYADRALVAMTIIAITPSGAQARVIVDQFGDYVMVSPAWAEIPTYGITYAIYATPLDATY